MTREERLSRDISAINASLKSIAEDLRYFRKKDEAAAVVEEPEKESHYTCKDCDAYKQMAGINPNVTIHWCEMHGCPISYNGLREPCSEFIKEVDSDAAK